MSSVVVSILILNILNTQLLISFAYSLYCYLPTPGFNQGGYTVPCLREMTPRAHIFS